MLMCVYHRPLWTLRILLSVFFCLSDRLVLTLPWALRPTTTSTSLGRSHAMGSHRCGNSVTSDRSYCFVSVADKSEKLDLGNDHHLLITVLPRPLPSIPTSDLLEPHPLRHYHQLQRRHQRYLWLLHSPLPL